MDSHNSTSARSAIQNWYLLLILGILLILLGIWVFRTPLGSFITLSLLFAFAFFFTGILEIVYAVSNRGMREGWGWLVAGGIIDFVLGILLMLRLDITMVILPLYVGFGLLARSILAIGWSIELKNQKVPRWGALLALAILSLIFSFILLWNPIFAGMTIVFYTGMAFIFVGILNVYLAFQLRSLRRNTS